MEYKIVVNSYSKGDKIIKRKDYIICGFNYLGNPDLCRVALEEENTYDIVPINKQNKILINGKWTKKWCH